MAIQVLLVHGAWHNQDGFAPLVSSLEELGVESNTLNLRSAQREGEPLGDMFSDAEQVRAAVDQMGDEVRRLAAHRDGGEAAGDRVERGDGEPVERRHDWEG